MVTAHLSGISASGTVAIQWWVPARRGDGIVAVVVRRSFVASISPNAPQVGPDFDKLRLSFLDLFP